MPDFQACYALLLSNLRLVSSNLYRRLLQLLMSVSEKCYNLVESNRFQYAILVMIVFNAATIGLETFDWSDAITNTLFALDSVIMWVFIAELIIRLIGHGSKFFRDSWNNFDFVIIIVSIAPSTGPFSILRVFRVFRALRLVSTMPEMQKMVEAMLRSLRGIAAISWLLCIVLYVFSVMATMLFGTGGTYGEEFFGSLGKSLYSLFQVMTLEAWSDGIARNIIAEQGWWAAIFFIIFIISTSFTFLNMFIAVFTNTMAAIDIEGGDDEGFSGMLNVIKSDIDELKELIQSSFENQDSKP
jgi:voltage-gated sodium channel